MEDYLYEHYEFRPMANIPKQLVTRQSNRIDVYDGVDYPNSPWGEYYKRERRGREIASLPE